MGEERLTDHLFVQTSYPLNKYISRILSDLMVYMAIFIPIVYLYYSNFDKSFLDAYFVLISIIVLLPLTFLVLRSIYNLCRWVILKEENPNNAKIDSIYFVSKNEIIQPVQFIKITNSTGEKFDIKPHSDFKNITVHKDDFYQPVEFEPILLDLDKTCQIQYDEVIIEFHLTNISKYMEKNRKQYGRLVIELQSKDYINPDLVESQKNLLKKKFQQKYNQNADDYVPIVLKDYKFIYQIIAVASLFLVVLPEFSGPPGFADIIPFLYRLIIALSPLILVVLLYIPEKRKGLEVAKIRNM